MRSTGLLFYRSLASPLHATRAWIGALWAAALALAALLLYHPLALFALTLAILGAGVGAGVGRELARALRMASIVALPIVAINLLASRQGLTVFARLGDLGPFGEGDLTVEALVYGAVIALKVTTLILISALAGLAVDPDEMLRIFRRFSFRSALTASLAIRMVPVLGADAARLAEAQRTRPGGAPRGARGRVALLSAMLSGSLDRAMDVAATLELRGFAAAAGSRRTSSAPSSSAPTAYGVPAVSDGLRMPAGALRGPRRWRRPTQPWSRHDIAFSASAAALVALALAGRLAGAASFEAYPTVHAPVGLATVALCVALPVVVLAPLIDRRGIDP